MDGEVVLAQYRDCRIRILYANEDTANEGSGLKPERCAPGWFGLTICEVRGRPCAKQTELECKHDEGQACDPKVKSIQSKLSGRGYSVGPIDGILGPRTREAIKDFKKESKKDNKFADASSLNDEIDALNKSAQTKTASQSLF